jgi:hypothetical protein
LVLGNAIGKLDTEAVRLALIHNLFEILKIEIVTRKGKNQIKVYRKPTATKRK